MNKSFVHGLLKEKYVAGIFFRKVKYCLSQPLSRTIKILINRILLYLARILSIHLGKLLHLPFIAGPVWQAPWRKESENCFQKDASFHFS